MEFSPFWWTEATDWQINFPIKPHPGQMGLTSSKLCRYHGGWSFPPPSPPSQTHKQTHIEHETSTHDPHIRQMYPEAKCSQLKLWTKMKILEEKIKMGGWRVGKIKKLISCALGTLQLGSHIKWIHAAVLCESPCLNGERCSQYWNKLREHLRVGGN